MAHQPDVPVLVGLAFAAALVINLSNSLGALVGRNSRSTAETVSKANAIRDDRTGLARLQKALERLGPYVATDKAAVDAAQRATDAATTAKELNVRLDAAPVEHGQAKKPKVSRRSPPP